MSNHKLQVTIGITLTPEQVADVMVHMTEAEFAQVFGHLYQRTQLWGTANRIHLWGDVRKYLLQHPDNMMSSFVQELAYYTRNTDEQDLHAASGNRVQSPKRRRSEIDERDQGSVEPAREPGEDGPGD